MWLIGAVLVAAAGALTLMRGGRAPVAVSRTASIAAVAPAPEPPAPEIAPSESAVSIRLQREFQASRDWRAFAREALKRPREGGYFYAMHVGQQCSLQGDSRRDSAGSPSLPPRPDAASGGDMQGAIERLWSSCAAFAPHEASALQRTAQAQATPGQDPLIDARRAVAQGLAANDGSRLRAAVQGLLATGDPLALSQGDLLKRVMAASAGKADGAEFWFAGKVYGPFDDRELTAFLFASQLALCRRGTPCEFDDRLLLACVTGGDCGLDRRGFVRQQLLDAGIADTAFARFQVIEHAMAMAIALGNAGAFVK